MHPIEALRYVARAGGGDASMLVTESASALSFFADDPAGMLTAARQLLTRQPAIGPLWDLAAHLAVAVDPRDEARRVIERHRSDGTARHLATELPDGATVVISGWPDLAVQGLLRRGDLEILVLDVEGQARPVVGRFDRADILAEAIDPARLGGAVSAADLVLVEAAAAGDSLALVEAGNLALAATAKATATPAWLVAGVGRRLPEPYWQVLIERVAGTDLPAWLDDNETVSLSMFDRVATPDGLQLVAELPPSTTPLAPELLRIVN